MGAMNVSRKHRLIATIVISLIFFLTELVAGFYTHSLALVADAFHYLSDLVGFVVALVAIIVSEREKPPPAKYTFGWQRTSLLGAFFNGVFLLALGISILFQAIERFARVAPIENPLVVLIVGCVGLGLNVLAMSFLHEHKPGDGHGHNHGHCHGHEEAAVHSSDAQTSAEIDSRSPSISSSHHDHKHTTVSTLKSPGRDLGMLGVFLHVLGDAINNIGVIASALIILKVDGPARYYADPAVGVFIAIMIFLTAVPLVKKSGSILLESAPDGINPEDVKHDLERIPAVMSVHDLHIWRINQKKAIASAHVVVDGPTVQNFTETSKIIMECLRAYGIHSATLQPEFSPRLQLESPPLAVLPAAADTATDAATPQTKTTAVATNTAVDENTSEKSA